MALCLGIGIGVEGLNQVTNTVTVGYSVRHRLPLCQSLFHARLQFLHLLDLDAVFFDMIQDDAPHAFAGRFAVFRVPGYLPDFVESEAELFGHSNKVQPIRIPGGK